jgi:MFS transporter, PPP family, 3-phenylpropionic acid transporter
MNTSKILARRLTTSYAFIQSYYNMSYCCIIGFATVFLLSRNFTNVQVGITLAVANTLSFLCQPLVAAVADRSKKLALRNIVALLLLVLAILAMTLYMIPDIVLPTAILYVILVCFQYLPGPLITSMAMEHNDAGTEINFGLARGIGSFAYAVLSLFMGFFTQRFGGSAIIMISIILSLIGIILVSIFPNPPLVKNERNNVPENVGMQLLQFALENKRFVVVCVSIILVYFSHALIDTYLIQIMRTVGGNSSDVGIGYAIAGGLELPAMALFPLILKRLKSASTIMKLSAVFFLIRAVITLLAHSVAWVYVAQCCQFFAFALLIPASVYFVDRIINGEDRVKGQSFMTMSIGISNVIATVLGGFMLGTNGDVGLMLIVGVIASLIGLIMLVLVIPRDVKRVTVPRSTEAL